MSDLISREALHRDIESIRAKYGNENSSLIEQGEVLDLIAEAPAVDAVEVVRCKDCRYGTLDIMSEDYIVCWQWNTVMPNDGFCSYGGLKEVSKDV